MEEKAEIVMKKAENGLRRAKVGSGVHYGSVRMLLWRMALIAALLPICVPGFAAPGAPTPQDMPTSVPVPGEMRNFLIYITEQGAVVAEVRAELCYLYLQLDIAYMRRLHVDFLTTSTQEKDTLDAPEGYLYLKNFTVGKEGDLRLDPRFPFYKQIGGSQASIDLLTTTPKWVGPLPEKVRRFRNDIDLMGRPGRRVIYRRADGTELSCERAYRDGKQAILYGVGKCQMKRPMGDKNQFQVISGEYFISDDKLKKIAIRGQPQFGSE